MITVERDQQNVAVVPGANSARDKTMANADVTGKLPVGAGKDPKAPAGTYVVKQGDSLAKIAKATGTKIDDLTDQSACEAAGGAWASAAEAAKFKKHKS